jgi:hypothetical protein
VWALTTENADAPPSHELFNPRDYALRGRRHVSVPASRHVHLC